MLSTNCRSADSCYGVRPEWGDGHILPGMSSRRLVAALVCTLLALVVTGAASAGGSLVKVTSGRWDGRAWTFEASDQVSGVNVSFCS